MEAIERRNCREEKIVEDSSGQRIPVVRAKVVDSVGEHVLHYLSSDLNLLLFTEVSHHETVQTQTCVTLLGARQVHALGYHKIFENKEGSISRICSIFRVE